MDPSQNPNVFHATTIVSVRRNGRVAVAGDGQVTLGHTVMKANACKVRRLGRDGQVRERLQVLITRAPLRGLATELGWFDTETPATPQL